MSTTRRRRFSHVDMHNQSEICPARAASNCFMNERAHVHASNTEIFFDLQACMHAYMYSIFFYLRHCCAWLLCDLHVIDNITYC